MSDSTPMISDDVVPPSPRSVPNRKGPSAIYLGAPSASIAMNNNKDNNKRRRTLAFPAVKNKNKGSGLLASRSHLDQSRGDRAPRPMLSVVVSGTSAVWHHKLTQLPLLLPLPPPSAWWWSVVTTSPPVAGYGQGGTSAAPTYVAPAPARLSDMPDHTIMADDDIRPGAVSGDSNLSPLERDGGAP